MHRGYIKIWRKIKDSGLYQLPETFTLFMFILTEATHQPRRVGSTLLQRGQYSSGRIELARILKQSEQTVRTGLGRLKRLEILTIETTSHGSIYTVVNYSLYQVNEGDANQQTNQPLTSDQPAANQPLTSDQPHNKHKTHKHINTNKKHSAEYSADFDIFWKAYPSKTGKDAAYKSWKKLNPTIQDVLKALEWQVNSEKWISGFIPNPATYLNQGRWQDEPIIENKNNHYPVVRICGIEGCGLRANLQTSKGWRCAGHMSK